MIFVLFSRCFRWEILFFLSTSVVWFYYRQCNYWYGDRLTVWNLNKDSRNSINLEERLFVYQTIREATMWIVLQLIQLQLFTLFMRTTKYTKWRSTYMSILLCEVQRKHVSIIVETNFCDQTFLFNANYYMQRSYGKTTEHTVCEIILYYYT